MGLLYAGPHQINFMVPHRTIDQIGRIGSLVVRRGGIESAPTGRFSFMIADPRIFHMGFDCHHDSRVTDTTPCGLRSQPLGNALYAIGVAGVPAFAIPPAKRGAITDLLGNLVTSANPARLGEWYSIWFTGLGPLAPDGKPVYPVRLQIGFDGSNLSGGIPGFSPGTTFSVVLQPTFAGESPQFPGLNQINFRLTIPFGIALSRTSGYSPCGPSGNKLDLKIQIVDSPRPFPWQPPSDRPWLDVRLFDLPILIRPGDAACR